MKLLYTGKTKNVYDMENGHYLLKFKDDATGTDGKFDPGANTVGVTIEGYGISALVLTDYFFRKLSAIGIPTHYVSADIGESTMTVKPAKAFGNGLEVICRFRAVGSFIRRYGMYATEGQELDAFVEITLKDDERGDPPISKEGLRMLGILSDAEYDALTDYAKRISRSIKDVLAKKGMELYDIKLEFGAVDGEVALIDELSGGNMRVYKDGICIEPLELTKLVTAE